MRRGSRSRQGIMLMAGRSMRNGRWLTIGRMLMVRRRVKMGVRLNVRSWNRPRRLKRGGAETGYVIDDIDTEGVVDAGIHIFDVRNTLFDVEIFCLESPRRVRGRFKWTLGDIGGNRKEWERIIRRSFDRIISRRPSPFSHVYSFQSPNFSIKAPRHSTSTACAVFRQRSVERTEHGRLRHGAH